MSKLINLTRAAYHLRPDGPVTEEYTTCKAGSLYMEPVLVYPITGKDQVPIEPDNGIITIKANQVVRFDFGRVSPRGGSLFLEVNPTLYLSGVVSCPYFIGETDNPTPLFINLLAVKQTQIQVDTWILKISME